MLKTAADIAKNASDIAVNTGTLDHIIEVGKLYGWAFGIIAALLIYTWHQKEKAQDKLELLLTTHIKENDKVHNKVFDDLRGLHHKVDTLCGAHDEITKGGHP
jgi:hypothetical protein